MKLFDPKPCPKRAQKESPAVGAFVSGAATSLTKSHRSELNRRPLSALFPAFSGLSRLFNELKQRITAFQGRKVGNSRPESVPETCLAISQKRCTLTKPLSEIRLSKQGSIELEEAVRRELRTVQFRRWY